MRRVLVRMWRGVARTRSNEFFGGLAVDFVGRLEVEGIVFCSANGAHHLGSHANGFLDF